MSTRKPESTFVAGVHSQALLTCVHKEKMANPYRSGTADVWYSGSKGDLWIEYKYLQHVPRSEAIAPDLSPGQRKWLNDRAAEGRNVAVVLGFPKGCVLYRNGAWTKPLSTERLMAQALSRKELAEWILSVTGTSPSLLQASPRR